MHYIYIYIYLAHFMHTHTHTHTHTYICVCVCVRVCAHTLVYLPMAEVGYLLCAYLHALNKRKDCKAVASLPTKINKVS